MKLLRSIVFLACATVPLAGLAQWQWIDKDGRKVFSDQSPPADIPLNKILRQPGGRSVPVAVPVAAAASAPASAASAPKLTTKDKGLEDKKKLAEAAEAEKAKAEEERVAKAKAENCARAKQAKAGFDTGARIATTNVKGEREIMDDATRAAETKRIQGIIAADCKAS